ncbi:MAG TPA: hypothetical protein VH619_00280 [Verrucomicrobiae bacterium]|jgi:hypothetical protein|nr:hypothetical protein [Verrucomicrobiae bacterium]
MKFLITVVIIGGLAIGAWQLNNYWGTFKPAAPPAQQTQPEIPDDQLPGMPASLQPALDAARQRGAVGLHDFLKMYGNSISDPRRAAIELDYVVLVAPSSATEARRAFAKVKGRLQPGSPVYNRMTQLEKTYDTSP